MTRPAPLLARERPTRVAVLRALQLGDLLCTVPALRALRAALPAAEITLIGLPWARWFVRRFDAYLDGLIEFPGFPGFPEREPDVAAFPGFLAGVQARRFDLAIQLHGSGALSNPLTMLLGAYRTAGYYLPGAYCPDLAAFLPYPEDEHELRSHLRLMSFLGAPAEDERIDLPARPEDEAALETTAAAGLPAGGYVCVHPGARYPSRRWGAERFAAVADRLAGDGLTVVLTGSDEERPVTAAVRTAMRAPALDLAGTTSLDALVALVRGARLVVCNDTGISHVAAGTGTASVVVASGSDARRWAPLDTARHRTLWHDTECRPCPHRDCPFPGHPCAAGVEPAEVIATADALLRTAARTPALAADGGR